MSDAVSGLIGALIGGSAAIAGAWLQARSSERTAQARLIAEEKKAQTDEVRATADRRQALSRRYLFGLQDAAESLRRRLQNWADRDGQRFSESHDPGYWDMTTLYAVARALAAERILALESVYPAMEAEFPKLLDFYKKEGLDAALAQALGGKLFRYHRLALAEAALERDSLGFRILIYSEFRRRYDDSTWGLERLLQPATDALTALTPPQMKQLEERLERIVAELERVTGVPRTDETRDVGT